MDEEGSLTNRKVLREGDERQHAIGEAVSEMDVTQLEVEKEKIKLERERLDDEKSERATDRKI